MTGSDQPDWPEIRRLYVAGKLTLACIAERHGISAQRITRRARNERWPARARRGPAARDGPATASHAKKSATAAGCKRVPPQAATSGIKQEAAAPGTTSLKTRRALVRRLYKAIDTKLKQMERRMAQDIATKEGTSDTTAADHERDTRAIGALIANLSRVTEMEADLERLPGSTNPATSQGDRQLADEAERFRRDVAERLARLVGPA
ncbi:MAG: hypothetical protein J0I75_04765 [Hyphomicrobium sp.]|nr:hypothetical protein [Hyphomicrobium sp.]